MSKQEIECVNCGKLAVQTVLRDNLFGKGERAVIIESVPLQQRRRCGIVYLEPAVSRAIDASRPPHGAQDARGRQNRLSRRARPPAA